MLSSFSSLNSIARYTTSVAVATPSISVTSITGNYTLNSFSMTGKTVYQFYNDSTPANSTSITQSGSFTITVTGASKTIYYILVGGGSGGGSGNQGGGGGGAGQLTYGSITLPVGTYNCTYQIGGGGYGANYVGSAGTFVSGANGYGRLGTASQFVCNGSTINANTGAVGGPSYYSNGCTGYPCGGGAGCNFSGSSLSGSSGSVFNGGNSNTSANSSTGGGGGASNYEAGGNGGAGDSAGGNAGSGGVGGRATRSSDLPSPYNAFASVLYFSEGGSGACSRTAISSTSINPVSSYYGYGGFGSGVPDGTGKRCTSATVSGSGGWGSGGGGAFQNMGVGSSSFAGAGANGVLFLFY